MEYIDNTTKKLHWSKADLEPDGYIELMKKCGNMQGVSADTIRSEWTYYLLAAANVYDIVIDKNKVIFCDKD